MKNQKGKRRGKRGKISQGRAKELIVSSTEEDEVKPRRAKTEDKDLIADELQLPLVCEDHYSLYERTSLRQNWTKKDIETPFEKCEEDRKHKSSLPPLRDQNHRRCKQLTFEGESRANKHSILDTKPDGNRNAERMDNATSSEVRQKLALSLSFVGIYDLDDMGLEGKTAETNQNKTLDGILKSSKDETEAMRGTLDKSEGTCAREMKCENEVNTSKRTKSYVIKTLTLEDESPSRQKTFFQDKIILPGIKKNALSTRLNKIIDDERQITKARDKQSENRLPRIGQSENRIPTFSESCPKRTINSHRRKERVHDNSCEQLYLEGTVPRLPLLVNGRETLS